MPAEFAMRAVFLLMLVLGALTPQRLQAAEEERAAFVQESREMVPVSYTHLTLPTNREV